MVDLGNDCVQATKWNGNAMAGRMGYEDGNGNGNGNWNAHTQPSPEVPFNYLHTAVPEEKAKMRGDSQIGSVGTECGVYSAS